MYTIYYYVLYSIGHTIKSQLIDLSYYLWPIDTIASYYLFFLQDLLSGKYYRDKAELRKQKMIAKKIKNEKAMTKPELPLK